MRKEIDKFAERTLKEWNIPGLALAIVHKDDRITAGYGIKNRETKETVNSDTLFQIASLTKAFTGTAVNMLVEESKLHWEQPIISYLPNFKLKDPIATKEMTLRDLLSHRTGLPGVSREEARRFWYHTNDSTEDLIHRLAYVDPASSFRSHFAYNDMPYVIAGEIIAKLSGKSFAQFCEERIFTPLGMKRTYASYTKISQDANIALGHLQAEIQYQPVPLLNWDNMAAAGGIATCANDIALWLQYCLSNSSTVSITQVLQTLFEIEGFIDEISRPSWSIFAHEQKLVGYGYGWMIYTLDNKKVLFHLGLSDGFQSIIGIVPEEQLGIAIFVNQATQLGAASLYNQLLDYFLNREQIDWHQKAHQKTAEIDRNIGQKTDLLRAVCLNKLHPSLPLTQYSGKYVHPAYGEICIQCDEDTLKIKLFSQDYGKLQHWNKDQFAIVNVLFAPPLPWLIDFHIRSNNAISLVMPGFGNFERLVER